MSEKKEVVPPAVAVADPNQTELDLPFHYGKRVQHAQILQRIAREREEFEVADRLGGRK